VYPHVVETLDVVRRHLPMAVVTDAQSAFARAELHKVGLVDYFHPIVVSGDLGFVNPTAGCFNSHSIPSGYPR
jgi:putative hydrolase of the HAD superfamily